MRIASIDIGSNSFLLMICEIENENIVDVLFDHVEIVQLGQGVHESRQFHPDALARAEDCFKNFDKIIKQYNTDRVVAVATSASRDVINKQALLDLGSKYGIPISIITGQIEAELSFLGATYDIKDPGNVVLIDIGGGSTEFLFKESDDQVIGRSINIGSVRLKELFAHTDPMKEEEILGLTGYIKDKLQEELGTCDIRQNRVIAVAGTPTSLACMDQKIDFDETLVHGYKMSGVKIRKWSQDLLQMTTEERAKIQGLNLKRASVIAVGVTILNQSLQFLGLDEIEVSTKGVRYGAALSYRDF